MKDISNDFTANITYLSANPHHCISSVAYSRLAHAQPLAPKAFISLPRLIRCSELTTSLLICNRSMSSEPIAMKVKIVGAALRETLLSE